MEYELYTSPTGGHKNKIEAASSFPKTCYEAQETALQASKPRTVGMQRLLAEENSGFGG